MKTAVLLTCHNRKVKTLECLERLYSQLSKNDFKFSVFLVDDGCTDGTAEAVAAAYPQTHLIKGNGELFWNRGMCLAWEEARKNGNYDGVVWLNDDTMLKPDAFQQLFQIASNKPDCIVVGTTESTAEQGFVTYGGLRNWKIVQPDDPNRVCDTFNGNIVFIPKSVSDKIGYLDPYFRHSAGDYDYGLRANELGVSCIAAPIIGVCNRNPTEPIWNKGNLIQRFKKLYTPLGNNPFETFHFYKNRSFVKAVGLFIYIHLRVLFIFFIPKK